jgi:hypothetical protein
MFVTAVTLMKKLNGLVCLIGTYHCAGQKFFQQKKKSISALIALVRADVVSVVDCPLGNAMKKDFKNKSQCLCFQKSIERDKIKWQM